MRHENAPDIMLHFLQELKYDTNFVEKFYIHVYLEKDWKEILGIMIPHSNATKIEVCTCLTYSRCLIDTCYYYKRNRADL